MSSFLKKLKNPKTGKKQTAFCIDNFFGHRNYGYGFPKDGSNANFEYERSVVGDCDWFTKEELEEFNK